MGGGVSSVRSPRAGGERGAARVDHQQPPFLVAVRQGEVATCKRLVQEKGKEIVSTCKSTQGLFAFHVASLMGDTDMLGWLGSVWSEGVTLRAEASGNPSPLHCAATFGHVGALDWLLGHGAGVDDTDSKGCTALFAAVRSGFVLAAIHLLEKGADVSKADADGNTPLHVAMRKGHYQCAKALVAHGCARADIENNEGHTPFHLAAREGHVHLVELCVKEGLAHAEAQDHQGRTALDLATAAQRSAVVALLSQSPSSVLLGDGARSRRSGSKGDEEVAGEGTELGAVEMRNQSTRAVVKEGWLARGSASGANLVSDARCYIAVNGHDLLWRDAAGPVHTGLETKIALGQYHALREGDLIVACLPYDEALVPVVVRARNPLEREQWASVLEDLCESAAEFL